MNKTIVLGLLMLTTQAFALVKTEVQTDTVRIELTGDDCKQEQNRILQELKAAKRVVLDKRDCASVVMGEGDIGSIAVLK